MEKERLKELFDLEQQLGINENDRFHNSEDGKKQYEAIFENQHACNDIKNEILIKNMKAIAAKKIESENDLKAKNDEIENQLMNTTIDDLYIESKCYFEVKKKLDDTQKELIDLRVELRVEKEKSKALEEYSRGLELKYSELKKYLEDNVESCKEKKNHFKSIAMEMSAEGSGAMWQAYKNVLEFIKNQK